MSATRECQVCSSMQPRFAIHARPAGSVMTGKSASRPLGNWIFTVSSQSGCGTGTRFW
jgi:hypothetical protein